MREYNMNNKFALLIVSALFFAGCTDAADTGGELADEATPSFAEVYAAAEIALAEATARRNVWSKTEEMLSDAKVAFDNGEVEAAIELATEAKLQAELAVTQADYEKTAWRSRVLTE